DGTYAVNFKTKAGQNVFVRVDADLWTYASGTPVYAKLGPQKSLWVAVVEKAWAFYARGDGWYASIHGGFTPSISAGAALGIKGDKHPTETYALPVDYLEAIRKALDDGKAVTFGAPWNISDTIAMTYDDPSTPDDPDDGTYRRGSHIFAVEKV